MTHQSKLAALIVAIMLATAPIAARATEGAEIAGFQAFLFNSGTGGFSPDVIKNQITLGNIVASDYQSVSTFVVVDIGSGDAPLPDTARLRLTATEAGKTGARVLLDSTQRPRTTGTPGVTHVGFWLADTGCAVITLRATLTANSKAAGKTITKSNTKTTTLDFHCYE